MKLIGKKMVHVLKTRTCIYLLWFKWCIESSTMFTKSQEKNMAKKNRSARRKSKAIRFLKLLFRLAKQLLAILKMWEWLKELIRALRAE
jgi:hypothetical protein